MIKLIKNVYYKINKLVSITKKSGLKAGAHKVISYFNQFKDLEAYFIQRKREKLSSRFTKQYGNTVRYGPLKGTELWSGDSRGDTDKPSMLLGFYEQEVITAIVKQADNYDTFVNIGSADGYYSVGLIKNNFFKQSICFEASDNLRRVSQDMAKRNKVSDKLVLLGSADENFTKQISHYTRIKDCLILCDIEGGEFSIFREETIKELSSSIILIEIHDFVFKDGARRYKRLCDLLRGYFNLQEFKTGARNLSTYPEISSYNDTDRWLLCSEGRTEAMKWLLLTPRNN